MKMMKMLRVTRPLLSLLAGCSYGGDYSFDDCDLVISTTHFRCLCFLLFESLQFAYVGRRVVKRVVTGTRPFTMKQPAA